MRGAVFAHAFSMLNDFDNCLERDEKPEMDCGCGIATDSFRDCELYHRKFVGISFLIKNDKMSDSVVLQNR